MDWALQNGMLAVLLATGFGSWFIVLFPPLPDIALVGLGIVLWQMSFIFLMVERPRWKK